MRPVVKIRDVRTDNVEDARGQSDISRTANRQTHTHRLHKERTRPYPDRRRDTAVDWHPSITRTGQMEQKQTRLGNRSRDFVRVWRLCYRVAASGEDNGRTGHPRRPQDDPADKTRQYNTRPAEPWRTVDIYNMHSACKKLISESCDKSRFKRSRSHKPSHTDMPKDEHAKHTSFSNSELLLNSLKLNKKR